MSKVTHLQLSKGNYTLEAHGPIHVTKNGQYGGCIEFRGGFGPVTYKMVQSAIDNAVEYFQPDLTAEEIVDIGKAIRRIMIPAPTSISNSQMGLIYAGLACGACLAREKGHDSDAKVFHEIMDLVDALRMSDFNFEIVPKE